jgi:hypothetical protein
MPAIIAVHGNFRWLVYRRTPESRWIGVCDPLNLGLEADSLDELYNVIAEGVDLLLRDLWTDNELQRYMTEIGWQLSGLPRYSGANGTGWD